jgi:hypothetical protein
MSHERTKGYDPAGVLALAFAIAIAARPSGPPVDHGTTEEHCRMGSYWKRFDCLCIARALGLQVQPSADATPMAVTLAPR